MNFPEFLLPIGFIAGLIDSVAGGGGLITVPAITLVLGHGPESIGTNKLSAVFGTFVSFYVYYRAGHAKFRSALPFAILVGIASMIGSFITPTIPREVFPWLLLCTCPVVLFVIWKKEIWLREHPPGSKGSHFFWIILSGLVVGLYDGLWGPGGGTFMFLALVFLAKLPLLESLAASKLANFFSAGTSLFGYSLQGYVSVYEGSLTAAGMIIGSIIGARLATKHSIKIVRPMLLLVVCILLIRIVSDLSF